MKSSIALRSKGFGLAGSLAGMLALIAVVIPQWILPPPLPVSHTPAEMHRSFRERFVEKLQKLDHNRKEASTPAGWREGVPAIALLLALAAIVLGVISVLRGETHLIAGVAATLGIGALAFQLTFFYAVAASLVVLLYAGMERPEGAAELAAITICALLVMSVLAFFGLGLSTALLLAGAAIALVGLGMYRC